VRPSYLLPEAEWDVEEASVWYERQAQLLGQQFLDELLTTLDAIEMNPARYPRVHPDVRRALMHRFPYAVFFVEERERIAVIAVMHGRRNPRDWKARV